MSTLDNIMRQSPEEIGRVRAALNTVYNTIPATEGCMGALADTANSCGAWCCETQNPQALYAEFVNSWRHVNEAWDKASVIDLIVGAVRNYLSNQFSKGCIFWDGRTKHCTQHATRPFNCRIYGITPEEEFKPRYEALKVLRPEVRDQCNLVKTVDGSAVTKSDTDGWWKELVKVEMTLGIPARRITDAQNGTYRTFHDHIILTLYGDNPHVMKMLTNMRLHGSEKAKEALIQEVRTILEKQEEERKKNEDGTQADPAQAGPAAG